MVAWAREMSSSPLMKSRFTFSLCTRWGRDREKEIKDVWSSIALRDHLHESEREYVWVRVRVWVRETVCVCVLCVCREMSSSPLMKSRFTFSLCTRCVCVESDGWSSKGLRDYRHENEKESM